MLYGLLLLLLAADKGNIDFPRCKTQIWLCFWGKKWAQYLAMPLCSWYSIISCGCSENNVCPKQLSKMNQILNLKNIYIHTYKIHTQKNNQTWKSQSGRRWVPQPINRRIACRARVLLSSFAYWPGKFLAVVPVLLLPKIFLFGYNSGCWTASHPVMSCWWSSSLALWWQWFDL